MTLILRKTHLDELKKHAIETYPMEACGIMAGRFKGNLRVLERIFKAKNILNSPYKYEIDPSEQLSIFQKADDLSMEVIGFYHSHPYGEAKPSGVDHSLAFYPNLSYAIYSVMTKSLASYIWDGNSFKQEPVKIL